VWLKHLKTCQRAFPLSTLHQTNFKIINYIGKMLIHLMMVRLMSVRLRQFACYGDSSNDGSPTMYVCLTDGLPIMSHRLISIGLLLT